MTSEPTKTKKIKRYYGNVKETAKPFSSESCGFATHYKLNLKKKNDLKVPFKGVHLMCIRLIETFKSIKI